MGPTPLNVSKPTPINTNIGGRTTRTQEQFSNWGPGKYDPRHHAFDGTTLFLLNSSSVPVVLPPIYGLKGVGFETFSGVGPITYWNC